MTVVPLTLTTKRFAHLPHLALACGACLEDVVIGYETYGSLNADRDNAVLVCHYFSGTSHAAARYTPDDAAPGWWDDVIGPGKAIDTDRWFVIAIDALGCVRLDAPHGVTTSPSSLNPATGRAYGPYFPPVAIADMVEAQRQVLNQLGINRLAAVAGPSLGAMQALEWAVRRPDEVDRVIAAIGPTELQPREHGIYRAMEDAIRLDPAFRDGRYEPDAPPSGGMALALKLMMVLAGGREVPGAPDRRNADAFEAWLDAAARARAATCDANAWISMLRANTRWRLGQMPLDEAARRIRARVLLLPGSADGLLPLEAYHTPFAEALTAQGADLTVATLPARYGHLAGLADIGHASEVIRACMGAL